MNTKNILLTVATGSASIIVSKIIMDKYEEHKFRKNMRKSFETNYKLFVEPKVNKVNRVQVNYN